MVYERFFLDENYKWRMCLVTNLESRNYIDENLTIRIPPTTLDGGILKIGDEVKEYRVWVRGRDGSSNYNDVYYREDIKEKIEELYIKLKDLELRGLIGEVRPPTAVIWDKRQQQYREVFIPTLKYVKNKFNVLLQKSKK